MPKLKLLNESYYGEGTLKRVVDYVTRLAIVGGINVDPDHAVSQMLLIKKIWHKQGGRQVRHFILSFADNEALTIDEAMDYGQQIAMYYGRNYQIVYGVHYDTNHLHLHFAFNSVSFVDGKMYSGGRSDMFALRLYIQSLMPQWYVQPVTDEKSETPGTF